MAQLPALLSAHDVDGRDLAERGGRWTSRLYAFFPPTMLTIQGRERAGWAGSMGHHGGRSRNCVHALVGLVWELGGACSPALLSRAILVLLAVDQRVERGKLARRCPGRLLVGMDVIGNLVGMGVVGYTVDNIPTGTVSGPSSGEWVREGAPISPYIVSAVDDRSGHASGPSAAPFRSGRFPQFPTGGYQPRMLSMGKEYVSSDGRQNG